MVSEWRYACTVGTSAGFLAQGFRKSAKHRGIWELGYKGRIELSQQNQGEGSCDLEEHGVQRPSAMQGLG